MERVKHFAGEAWWNAQFMGMFGLSFLCALVNYRGGVTRLWERYEKKYEERVLRPQPTLAAEVIEGESGEIVAE